MQNVEPVTGWSEREHVVYACGFAFYLREKKKVKNKLLARLRFLVHTGL